MNINKIFGDKILIDTNIKQEDSILVTPEDMDRRVLRGIVIMIGTKCTNKAIQIGNQVLVKNFVGAPNIDKFKLYDTEHVLAVL